MAQIDASAPFNRAAARLAAIGSNLDTSRDRAIGTLARRLPVIARRDMQQEYNLRASRITDNLRSMRGDGYIQLTGSKRGIGLIEFGGRYGGIKTAGATAQVRRSGGREVYSGSFIATLRGGNRQIVERETKKRLPLHMYYGPSVAQMLRNKPRRDRLRAAAEEILDAEIARLTRGAR